MRPAPRVGVRDLAGEGAGQEVAEPEEPDRPDLRTPALAVAAWSGGLLGLLCPPAVLAGVLGALLLTALLLGRGLVRRVPLGPGGRAGRGDLLRAAAGCLLVLVAVAVVAGIRVAVVAQDPVAVLAAHDASVRVEATVTSDPRLRQGGFSDYVLLRARVVEVAARGQRTRVSAPVLVIADPSWIEVELGSRVAVAGRLEPADGDDLAGLLVARGDPEVRAPPGPLWRGADAVRDAIRDAVAHRPPSQAGLVPALVVGDDSRLPEDLTEDFRTTGLTHLLAVSGTNVCQADWCHDHRDRHPHGPGVPACLPGPEWDGQEP
ncbi:ComEC/Rec2 family competence protein [uncultured Nocardioides sp.]|uniref:ComEC/Rec2 family competence protein n=1 Tax=uncultured Nocardioides sp. TaxID=198441 RepID=UPI002626297B|nr:ComEC/Rec2 family competence protein [uncultured Nocardioides sp.]